MPPISAPYCYKAFGLNLSSSFPLSTLASVACDPVKPDVKIHFGDVLPSLNSAQVDTDFYQVNADHWLIRAEAISGARFLVQAGREIVVQQVNPEPPQVLRLFLLGSCMGAVVLQRGMVPLHGNTLAHRGHSIIVAGVSGAGKSTLTMALLQRGYQLVADDLSAVSLADSLAEPNTFTVQPGYPRLKLWAETCQQFGIDPQSLNRIRPELDKFHYPVESLFCAQSLPLKTIYLLLPESRETVAIETLTGITKLKELQAHLYKISFLEAQQIWPHLLAQLTALACQIRVCIVRRPTDGFQLEALTQLITEEDS